MPGIWPQEDNLHLESRMVGELRTMEEEAAKLSTTIASQRNAKQEALAEARAPAAW